MSKIWQQLVAIWGRLEVPQKATVVLALVGVAVLLGVIGWGSTRSDWRVLASGLPKSRLAEVAAALDQAHVTWQVDEHEGAVLVPSKDLYRMRNALAQQEMLGDGSHGFELLGKTSFMASSFSESKNYDRAVSGELERSFRELPGVRSARVLIDRPQPSPFVNDDAAKPKASVKLDMANGVRLTEKQIAGVVHLTAGAVAGLAPERVEVMDNSGRLSAQREGSPAAAASTALEAEMAREAYLTRRAQEQLDAVLGPGRSQVKVSVKLDFSKRAEASSDPTKSVLLEESTQSTNESTPITGNGGVAGTAPNVEGEGQAVQRPAEKGTKSGETASSKFVVGKKTVTIEDEVGRVRGMNVSILVDYKEVKEAAKPDPKAAKDAKPAEPEIRRVPIAEAELKALKELVLNSVGFNAAKDITAKVEGVANLDARFTSSIQSLDLYRPSEAAVAPATVFDPTASGWVGYGLAAFVALVLLGIARGQLRRGQAAIQAAEARAKAAEEEERRKQAAANGDDVARKEIQERRNELRSQIRRRIQEDPNAAAQVLRAWIYE